MKYSGSELPIVAPFQGLEIVDLSTQGGAALCPGLVCCAPSGNAVKDFEQLSWGRFSPGQMEQYSLHGWLNIWLTFAEVRFIAGRV